VSLSIFSASTPPKQQDKASNVNNILLIFQIFSTRNFHNQAEETRRLLKAIVPVTVFRLPLWLMRSNLPRITIPVARNPVYQIGVTAASTVRDFHPIPRHKYNHAICQEQDKDNYFFPIKHY